jgi:hypothetical protein
MGRAAEPSIGIFDFDSDEGYSETSETVVVVVADVSGESAGSRVERRMGWRDGGYRVERGVGKAVTVKAYWWSRLLLVESSRNWTLIGHREDRMDTVQNLGCLGAASRGESGEREVIR